MKKFFKISEALSNWTDAMKERSFRRFGRQGRSALEARKLNLEQLEERQLLAVTAAEYDAIRGLYTGLDLAEDVQNINLIEITSNNLTVTALQQAVDAARGTAADDLVVIRTSDQFNTMSLGDGSIEVNLDSAHYGSLTIVAWGGDAASSTLNLTGAQDEAFDAAVGSELSFGNISFNGSSLANISRAVSTKASDEINYAVLFNGGFDARNNTSVYYDEINRLYNILVTDYGLDAENIYILNADGTDPAADQNIGYSADVLINSDMTFATSAGSAVYSATNANLQTVMETVGDKMDNNDHLFVFTADHGIGTEGDTASTEQYLCAWGEFISGEQFADAMYNVTAGYVAISSTQCFSGGVLDDVIDPETGASVRTSAVNWYGMAAANYYETSWYQYDVDDDTDTIVRNSEESFATAVIDALDPNVGAYVFTDDIFAYAKANDPFADTADYPPNGGEWTGNTEHPWSAGASFPVFAGSLEETLSTPAIDSLAAAGQTVQLHFNSVENAVGYTLEYSTSAAFTESDSVSYVTGGTYQVSGLTAGALYYFRVRADGGKQYNNSEWSETVSVRTQLDFPSEENTLAKLTDVNDSTNYVYFNGTESAWKCGNTGVLGSSITILQDENGAASLELVSSWKNATMQVRGENAGDYWTIVDDTATWSDNGMTSPKREFTFVVWDNTDGDDEVDTGEAYTEFTVSVQWANISICINQPFPGESTVVDLYYDAQGNIIGFDTGHGFWDNRASAALLGNGIVGSDLLAYANTSEGFGAAEWGDEAIRQIIATGNFISDGETQLSPEGMSSLANWSSVDAYETFTISSLSDYLNLLEYNKAIYENPPEYVLVTQADYVDPDTGETYAVEEMECTDAALAALEAAGITVNGYEVGGTPTGLYDFEYEKTEETIAIPGTDVVFTYTGISPAHVGQDLVRDGGSYAFGIDESTDEENTPFNGHDMDDWGFPQPKDNGSYSVTEIREFLTALQERDPSTVSEAERAALESYMLELSSYSEGSYVIYLDFEGDDSDSNMLSGKTPRYTIDGDETRDYFTFQELAVMYEAWVTSSEDYALFNVNVTLNSAIYEAAADDNKIRGIIGGTPDDWLGSGPLEKPAGGISGGVASGAFYVFAQGSTSGAGIGNTVSHEAGHNPFGLHHQSQPGVEYYPGNSDWSAIMGGGSGTLTQWSCGEFPNACIGVNGSFSNVGDVQDDIKEIVEVAGLRPDENNVSIYTATYIDLSKVVSTDEVALAEGIVGGYWNTEPTAEAVDNGTAVTTFFDENGDTKNDDTDYFMFELADGEAYHFNIGGITFDGITNLDVRVNLYNAAGELLEVYDAQNGLNVQFTVSGDAGVYYLSVMGTGKETSTAGIYSDYGSLGMYDIRVSQGTTLRVSTAGELVAAIERINAMDGSEVPIVYLAAGSYMLPSELTLTHSATFRSEGGTVTIRGNGENRVMTIGDGRGEAIDVVFEGVNIANGYADFGAGLYINSDADVVFVDGTLSGNTATTSGGAVYLYGGTFSIFGGSVQNNAANEGGAGVYVRSGNFTVNDSSNTTYYDADATTVFSSNIINNDDYTNPENQFTFYRYAAAFGNARGGGVHISTGVATINNATFSSNRVSGWFSQGAGLYADGGSLVTITSSLFSSNRSYGDQFESYDVSGAGIYVNYDATVNLTDSSVRYNVAYSECGGVVTVEDAGGAGIYADGTLNVVNSSIGSNTIEIHSLVGPRAFGNGLGPRMGGAGIGGLNGIITVTNSTVNYNEILIIGDVEEGVSITSIGGAGIATYGGSVTVNDSTISNNSVTVETNAAYGIGGGIGSYGAVTLNDSIVAHNSAANGGGVYMYGSNAALSLRNSSVRYNNATGSGAGIYGDHATVDILESSYIVHNTINSAADGAGAGLYMTDTGLTMDKSFVEYNTVNAVGAAQGGGIYIHAGETEISDTYVYGNIVSVSGATEALGGGVYVDTPSFTMTLSEASGNTIEATGDGAIVAAGAGIYMLGGTLQTTTVTQNSLSATTSAEGALLSVHGGGVYARGLVLSSLVAQNYLSAWGTGFLTSLPSVGGAGISSATSGGQLTIENCTVTENVGFAQREPGGNPFYMSVAAVTSASTGNDLIINNSIVINNSVTTEGVARNIIQDGTHLEYFEAYGIAAETYSQTREIFALIHPNASDESISEMYQNWLASCIYKDIGVIQLTVWEAYLYNRGYSAAAYEELLDRMHNENGANWVTVDLGDGPESCPVCGRDVIEERVTADTEAHMLEYDVYLTNVIMPPWVDAQVEIYRQDYITETLEPEFVEYLDDYMETWITDFTTREGREPTQAEIDAERASANGILRGADYFDYYGRLNTAVAERRAELVPGNADYDAEFDAWHDAEETRYSERRLNQLNRAFVIYWTAIENVYSGDVTHDISVVRDAFGARSWVYGHNNYTGTADPYRNQFADQMDPNTLVAYNASSVWRHEREVRNGVTQITNTTANITIFDVTTDESPFLMEGSHFYGDVFQTDVFHWTLGDYHIDDESATAGNVLEEGDIEYLEGQGLRQTDVWGAGRISVVLDLGAYEWQADDYDDEMNIVVTSLRDYVNPNDGIITLREAIGGYTYDTVVDPDTGVETRTLNEVFAGYAAAGATISFDNRLNGGTFTPNYRRYYSEYWSCYYEDDHIGSYNQTSAYIGELYINRSITINAAATAEGGTDDGVNITLLAGYGAPSLVLVSNEEWVEVELQSVEMSSFYAKAFAPRTPFDNMSNYYSHSGGLVSYLTNSFITLTNCNFYELSRASGNTEVYTGVVSRADGPAYGAAFLHNGEGSTITVTNSVFSDNSITSYSVACGGAMSSRGADVELIGVTFEGNTASGYCEAYGGALYVENGDLTVREYEYQTQAEPDAYYYVYSRFINNSAIADATEDIRDTTSGDASLIGPRLAMPDSNNTVIAYGGAICVTHSTEVLLSGVTFLNNSASATSDFNENDHSILYHAEAVGGGIYVSDVGSLTIQSAVNRNTRRLYWAAPKTTSFANNTVSATVSFFDAAQAEADAGNGLYRTATAAGGAIGFSSLGGELFGVEIENNSVTATSNLGQAFAYGGGIQSFGGGQLALTNVVYTDLDDVTEELETNVVGNSASSVGLYGAISYGGGLSNYPFIPETVGSYGTVFISNATFSNNALSAVSQEGYAEALGGGLHNYGELYIATEAIQSASDWFKSGREKFEQQFNVLFNGNTVLADGNLAMEDSAEHLAAVAAGGGLYIADYLDPTAVNSTEYRFANIQADDNTVSAYSSNALIEEPGNLEARGGGVAIDDASTEIFEFIDSSASGNSVSAVSTQIRDFSNPYDETEYQTATVAGAGVYAGIADTTVEESRAARNTGYSVAAQESGSLGGGLYNENNTVLLIHRGRFLGNSLSATIDALGGGVYYTGSGDLQITGSSFAADNAVAGANAFGGGVYMDATGTMDVDCADEAVLTGEFELIEAQFDRFYLNTATGGTNTNSDVLGKGGGIYKDGGDALTITDATHIYANYASNNGGGVWYKGGSTLTVSDRVEFYDNAADVYGGAIFSLGNTEVIISETSFDRNTAGRDGGAIHNENATVFITASAFNDNSAANYGGAIYTINNHGTTIVGSTFANNTAVQRGGAIYNNTNNLDIDDSNFIENSATGENGYGGAICVLGYTETTIDGSRFEGNDAYGSGGAIYNYARDDNGDGFNLLIGTTDFIGNTAFGGVYGNGGAIYNLYSGVRLTGDEENGNLLTGNSATQNGGAIYNQSGELVISDYIIQNNSAGVSGGAIYNLNLHTDDFSLSATIDGLTLSDNSAETGSGGAIWNNGGELTITNYGISGNTAGVDGGAIYNYSTEVLTVESSVMTVAPESIAIFETYLADVIADETNNFDINLDGNGAVNEIDAVLFERYIAGETGEALIAGLNASDWGRGADLDVVVFNIDHNTAGGDGGAIWTRGDIVIDGLNLTDNTADGSGGAIYVRVTNGEQTTEITGDMLSRNTAGGDGGAIYAYATAAQTINLQLTEIDGNSAGTSGGAVYAVSRNNGQSFTLGDVAGNIFADISNNTAGGDGGALYLTAGGAQTTNIAGRDIIGNTAGGSGGAIYRISDDDGSVKLTGVGVVDDYSELSDNEAQNGSGGAIYSNRDSIIITDFAFFRNMASQDGGTIYSGAGAVTITASDGFIGNIVQDNEAEDGSGGFLFANGAVTITGYDFIGNSAGASGGAVNSDHGTVVITAAHGTVEYNCALYGSGGFLAAVGAITLDGYNFANNSAGEDGGAIYGESSVTVTASVEDTEGGNVENNRALFGDGGFLRASGTVNLYQYNYIANAAGGDGGAVYNVGGNVNIWSETIAPTVDNMDDSLLAVGNTADGDGGFVYSTDGRLKVRWYEITANAAGGDGGAIYHTNGLFALNYIDQTKAKSFDPIAKFELSDNTAGGSGGAVYHSAGEMSVMALNVQENEAGVSGGAFYLDETADYSIIWLSDISNNTAVDAGGAIYQGTGTLFNLYNVLVSDNTLTGVNGTGAGVYSAATTANYFSTTIAGNAATGTASQGGGVYVDGGTDTFTNSIIALNTAIEGAQIYNNGGVINSSYSLSSKDVAWSATPVSSKNYDEEGFDEIIFADPTNGDYRLMGDSTNIAMNAGNNDDQATTFDLDGNSRIYDAVDIDNDVIDMGAYEYSGETTDPPKYQYVYGEESTYSVSTGGDFTVDVWHRTNSFNDDGDMEDVTTLSVRIYYNSNLLTFNTGSSDYLKNDAKTNNGVFFVTKADSSNGDGDTGTNSYIQVTWDNPEHWGEGTLEKAFEILNLSFDVAQVTQETVTNINFDILYATFGFDTYTQSVSVVIAPPSYDVDGNGAVDLNDASMIIRYFNAEKAGTLDSLVLTDLIDAENADRDSEQVAAFIKANRSIFNINGDVTLKTKESVFTESVDGVLLQRYLAGYQDCNLVKGLSFPSGSMRRDCADIIQYIEGYVNTSGDFESSPASGPYQIVQGTASSSLNGQPVDLTVQHFLYDATGLSASTLSLRIHYDSSVLAFDAENSEFLLKTGVVFSNSTYLIFDDTENYDGDDSTDRYILVTWNNPEGGWTSGDSENPEDIFHARFTVIDADRVANTEILFSAADLTANYRFGGWDAGADAPTADTTVTIEAVNMNFDFDKNSSARYQVDLQSDVTLWWRLVQNPTISDDDLIKDITPDTEPGTAAEIKERLDWDNNADVFEMLDIDKNEEVNENDVRLLALYLGGFTGEDLVAGFYGTGDQYYYKTLESAIAGIEGHFELYMPEGANASAAFASLAGFAEQFGLTEDISVDADSASTESLAVNVLNDFALSETDVFAPTANGVQKAADLESNEDDELKIALLDQVVSEEDDWNDQFDLDSFVEETVDDSNDEIKTVFDADPLAVVLAE